MPFEEMIRANAELNTQHLSDQVEFFLGIDVRSIESRNGLIERPLVKENFDLVSNVGIK
jgi:hypothetical protein